VKIDLSPPDRVEAHFSVEPTSSGWYTRPVTVRVEAEDQVSRVVSQSIRLDGGPWQADELTVGTGGWHTVEFMAQDEAGHASAIYQTTANLDTAAPAGALSLSGSLCQRCAPATINVAVGDDHSGLAHWTLALIIPEPTPPALNPQGNLLASGSDQTRTITLEGGSLPAGPLILRLTVQDGAGWLITKELEVTNAPGVPGPTPTPWLLITATPWPTSSGQMTATPQPTVTATPGDQQDDDDNDDENSGNKGSGNNGSGGNSPGWIGAVAPIPTGIPTLEKTTIPAILPVTGGVVVAWGLGSSIALLLLGLMLGSVLTRSTRLLPVKLRLRTGIKQDHLHSEENKE
jgi:hypothetical protein